jgi:hypothetical protein
VTFKTDGDMQRTSETYTECKYTDVQPNPLNPRRIFDKFKLDVLEESIRANKILVPLTVYREEKDGKLYILDGERRWKCAARIEAGEVSLVLSSWPSGLKIPSELEDTLVYDRSTRVLTHRTPIDGGERDLLRSLSPSKTWRAVVDSLYSLSKTRPPKQVVVPVNIVAPPTPAANMLYMFHVHNLREQWELMPTALSLEILMRELKVEDDAKLAELTKLSLPNVRRCKTLLRFDKKYQSMMLDPDPEKRLKANLFIEMAPVLDFYQELGSRVAGGRNRNELTDLFIQRYRSGLIPSVIHFRRVLEARDMLEGTDRWDEVKEAAASLVRDPKAKIRALFEPLTAEDKVVQDATGLCKDFLSRLKTFKIRHATRARGLKVVLKSVRQEIDNLLDSLEGGG